MKKFILIILLIMNIGIINCSKGDSSVKEIFSGDYICNGKCTWGIYKGKSIEIKKEGTAYVVYVTYDRDGKITTSKFDKTEIIGSKITYFDKSWPSTLEVKDKQLIDLNDNSIYEKK